MEKLGIYCRVSSKSQENDGTSIEYQLKKGQEISKKLGMKPVFFNEGGKSSWKSNINTRPELVKMLNEIESKKIKNIWIWSMDRLGRNSESWYSILKILISWKINCFVGDSTKPYDFGNITNRLTIQILTLISTYDNELRRARMMFGKMESLKKGQTFIGGTVPFGYEVNNKNLSPHPTEKKMVKKIFEMYRDGKSTTDIQIKLNSSEHNPKHSKKGWNLGTIQKMLGNQIYVGKQVWNWKEKEPDGSVSIIEKIEIETPKLISKKLYNDVKKRLNKYKISNQYDTEYFSLLKGILVCDHCGLKLNHRRKKSGRYEYYYCVFNERNWKKIQKTENYVKYKRQHKSCGLKKSLIMNQTDELVWDTFIDIFSQSKWIREKYKSTGLYPKSKEEKESKLLIQKHRMTQTKLKKQLNSLNDSIVDVEIKNIQGGFISEPVYMKLIEKLNNQIIDIEKDIEQQKIEILNLKNRNLWIDWIRKMGDDIDKMRVLSLEEKKQKLNQFIKRIIVKYDSNKQTHKLKFEFHLPIVDDSIIYNDKKDKSKGYKIQKGNLNLTISHQNDHTYKPTESKKSLVVNIMGLLNEGLGYTEISTYLNDLEIKTIRGRLWTRQSVRRFYNDNSKSINIDVKKKD